MKLLMYLILLSGIFFSCTSAEDDDSITVNLAGRLGTSWGGMNIYWK